MSAYTRNVWTGIAAAALMNVSTSRTKPHAATVGVWVTLTVLAGVWAWKVRKTSQDY